MNLERSFSPLRAYGISKYAQVSAQQLLETWRQLSEDLSDPRCLAESSKACNKTSKV